MSGRVPVAAYRSQVDSIPGGLEIRIPTRRNVFVILFIGFWLCGWVLGETSAVGELLHPAANHRESGNLFLLVWLGGWTIGGAWAICFLLWSLAGLERIRVESDTLSVRREAFGIGIGKQYELDSVRDLRAVDLPAPQGPFGGRWGYGLAAGPIVFDYGATSVRFGAGIDTAEAKHLVSKLTSAKPALAPAAEA